MHIICLFSYFILLASLSQSATLNTLSKDCLCDVTSLCDDQCCCDTACAATVVSRWAALNLCADDTLPIPSCTSLSAQQPQKQDLYSGLMTIYKVIKQLFCIQQINFLDPTLSYSTSTSSIASFTLPSPQSFINTAILNLASFPTTLPVRNGMGTCHQTSTNLFKMNTLHDQQCMASITSGLLSISTYTVLAPLIRIFSIDTPSSPTATTITPTSTDCPSSTVCNNAVRYVQIYFNSNSQIDTTNSFILVGSTPQGSYFPIRYSYEFTTIRRSSQKGYVIGSYLQLASLNAGKYYRMSNPLNLAFRTPSGACTDAAGSDVSSLISLKFGVNAVYSCVGLSSSIYANLLGAVNLVGIYGAATTNVLDYISVTPYSGQSSKQNSVQLLISYKSIGSVSDNQFQIVQVQVNQVSHKNNEMALYVEYNRVPTTPSLVIPSPPIVDAYLPNDFLYPFYVV